MAVTPSYDIDIKLRGPQQIINSFKQIKKESDSTTTSLTRMDAKGRVLSQTLSRVDADGRRVTTTFKALGTKIEDISRLGRTLTLGLTVPIVALGASVIKLGTDAVEARNLVRVTFGDMTRDVQRWADRSSASLIQTRTETMRTAGIYFDMLKNMGLSKQQAYGRSQKLTELTADISSFYNLTPEGAFDKVRAGLTGEIEPLKQLGIVISENIVKEEAYRAGIAKRGDTLTEVQKVQARYNLLLQKTSSAQGDVARTSDEGANAMRGAAARYKEAGEALGTSLMPVVTDLINNYLTPGAKALGEWVKKFDELSKYEKGLALTVTVGVAAAGPALEAIANLALIAKINPQLLTAGLITGGAVAAGNWALNTPSGNKAMGYQSLGADLNGIYPGGDGKGFVESLGIPEYNGSNMGKLRQMDDTYTPPGFIPDSADMFTGTANQTEPNYWPGYADVNGMVSFRHHGEGEILPPSERYPWNYTIGALGVRAMFRRRHLKQRLGNLIGGAGAYARYKNRNSPWAMPYINNDFQMTTLGAAAGDDELSRAWNASGPMRYGQQTITNRMRLNKAFGAEGLMSIAGSDNYLQSAFQLAGGAIGGPIGGFLGGGIARTLKGLFGGGHKEDRGLEPSKPIYTSDVQLTERITQFLNIALPLLSKQGGLGIDRLTGQLPTFSQSASGVK